nr:probable protein phosphatase 2C 65 [Ipomoea batatas]
MKTVAGLAMARAFGDFCLKDYASHLHPGVYSIEALRQDEFVVLRHSMGSANATCQRFKKVGSAEARGGDQRCGLVVASQEAVHGAQLVVERASPERGKKGTTSSKIDVIAQSVCLFFKRPELSAEQNPPRQILMMTICQPTPT